MTMKTLEPTLAEIDQARLRIRDIALRSPLIPLQHEGKRRIYLKLENLQPVGSFKVRCAANALLSLPRTLLREGVVTASAGNFAQGLGYAARLHGVKVTSFIPDTAAKSKVEALRRYGVETVERPYADWWRLLEDPAAAGLGENFIHPVANRNVIAGNGTIGLELLDDVPDLRAVFVPYGGGGLSTGIAAAIKAAKPGIRVYACETTAGAPLSAALQAGHPVPVQFDPRTFITGMGSRQVLDSMWPLARKLLDGALVTTVEATANAVRRLCERHHIIVEGAGAVPVAAAMSASLADRIGDEAEGALVCIVSGGHLDFSVLAGIMAGELPE